jgi:lipoprotein-releasing system permease protein
MTGESMDGKGGGRRKGRNHLEWYIARRYLGSRKRGQFLSLITWIALGGVILGVMALIVVIAVMTGAQEDLRQKILDSTPHVLILERGTALRMESWREVRDQVVEVGGVVATAPFILTQVAIYRQDYAQPANLYGVSLELDDIPITVMESEIREGVLNLEPPESGLPPLILGSRLAARMQVFPGDTLLLIALENYRTDPFGALRPALRQFEVTGTFTTGMYDYDVGNIYTRLEDAQTLLDLRETDRVSGIGARIEDPWVATEVGDSIREKLGGYPYFVESWITTNNALFSALKLEKLAMAVILFLIVVVAAFNIISTLVMVVVDRTREIGILKSMGMTDSSILRVFMLQGLWIGVIGTVVGMTAGVVLCWILDRYEVITIPPDVYFVDRLPVSLHLVDVALITVASIVVAFAATIYPALQASHLEPVEAIRHE